MKTKGPKDGPTSNCVASKQGIRKSFGVVLLESWPLCSEKPVILREVKSHAVKSVHNCCKCIHQKSKTCHVSVMVC